MQIKDRFFQRNLSREDHKKLTDLRDEFARLAEIIDYSLKDGRCKSIVLTKIEEAAFWASKSISHKD